MSLIAASSGGTYTPAPVGNHLAICIRVIDIGTQVTPFKDEETGEQKSAHQVIVTWELCNEMMPDGRPFTVNKYYTCSLHEKATLRQHLDAWRGREFTDEELKGFHLKNILGKPCMVQVAHKSRTDGKVSANVAAVASVPKGMTIPAQVNPSVLFDLDEWNDALFASLGDHLKQTILKSNEAKAKGIAPAYTPPAATTEPDPWPADEEPPF